MTDSDFQTSATAGDVIRVTPHRAEVPFKIILTVIGVILWIAIMVSIIGAFYAVFLGVIFFMAHVAMITHIRGGAIKLGSNQLPELYQRVTVLAQRIGLPQTPQVYLMESGGALNAFATKFFGLNFVVLYSELVAACGDNHAALDFIIAHELGHLHRRHLRWRWLMLPALFIPFIGSAYSRACEYTCDQYGYLVGNGKKQGLDGLYILAAGPEQAAKINRAAFGDQIADLDSVWMRLGQWLGSHPPLVKRLRRLDPALAPAYRNSFANGLMAVLIAVIIAVAPLVGIGAYAKFMVDKFKPHQFGSIENTSMMPPESDALSDDTSQTSPEPAPTEAAPPAAPTPETKD